jgi:hypothetical protein
MNLPSNPSRPAFSLAEENVVTSECRCWRDILGAMHCCPESSTIKFVCFVSATACGIQMFAEQKIESSPTGPVAAVCNACGGAPAFEVIYSEGFRHSRFKSMNQTRSHNGSYDSCRCVVFDTPWRGTGKATSPSVPGVALSSWPQALKVWGPLASLQARVFRKQCS